MTNRQASKEVRRFKATKIKAEEGDEEAQNNLALMYHSGKGVPKNYKKAAKWFRKAAKQGHEMAQFYLGEMYHSGEGVPENYKKAAKWYHKSAEGRWYLAQYVLGNMYREGQGVPKNYKKAAKWFRKAAEQGEAGARELGELYYKGQGVPKDKVKAAKRIRKAAEQGDDEAQFWIGRMSEDDVEKYAWFLLAKANGIKEVSEMISNYEKVFTLEQIEKGQARALELHRLIEERKENPKPSVESP